MGNISANNSIANAIGITIICFGNMFERSNRIVAKEVANKAENDLQYPGQIKVTVIRETRAVHYAK